MSPSSSTLSQLALVAAAVAVVWIATVGPELRSMIRRAREIIEFRDRRLSELELEARDAYSAAATHGQLQKEIKSVAHEALRRGSRLAASGEDLVALEERLAAVPRELRVARDARPVVTSTAHNHPFAAESLVNPYAVRKPNANRRETALWHVGVVLDEIRLLHHSSLERVVLIFTLWTRLVAIALAPLLPALTAARTPLQDGLSLADGPWAAALALATVTAWRAPSVADITMDSGPRGLRGRRLLLSVEAPLTLLVCITSPPWLCCAFAVGWSNWWQRPVFPRQQHGFSWPRMWVFAGVVLSAQALGFWDQSVPADAAITEAVALVVLMGLVSNSYGAMLPASFGVFLYVLQGGRSTRSRALAGARSELLRAADALDTIAAGLRQEKATDEAETAGRCARQLRAVAGGHDQLRPTADDLEGLLLEALVAADIPDHGSDRATEMVRDAMHYDQPIPVTFGLIKFDPPHLAQTPVTDFREALHSIATATFGEARSHGEGVLSVVVSRAPSGALAVAVGNLINPDSRPGRGGGLDACVRAAPALPGGRFLPVGKTDGGAVGRPGEELWISRIELNDDAELLAPLR